MTWRVRTSAIRSVSVPSAVPGKLRARLAPSDGVVRVARGERQRVCDRDHQHPSGDQGGGDVPSDGSRRGDAFELVAVHGAEHRNGRTVDGAVDRDELEGHPLASVEHRPGDARRGGHGRPAASASTAATWSRNALSGGPNAGDVVAWAMMPSCTNASLSAPIATPEKLLVARGAS